jgi:hypothetical protein
MSKGQLHSSLLVTSTHSPLLKQYPAGIFAFVGRRDMTIDPSLVGWFSKAAHSNGCLPNKMADIGL